MQIFLPPSPTLSPLSTRPRSPIGQFLSPSCFIAEVKNCWLPFTGLLRRLLPSVYTLLYQFYLEPYIRNLWWLHDLIKHILIIKIEICLPSIAPTELPFIFSKPFTQGGAKYWFIIPFVFMLKDFSLNILVVVTYHVIYYNCTPLSIAPMVYQPQNNSTSDF